MVCDYCRHTLSRSGQRFQASQLDAQGAEAFRNFCNRDCAALFEQRRIADALEKLIDIRRQNERNVF